MSAATVMYFFVNSSLGMKPGKWGAQIGHGMQQVAEGICSQRNAVRRVYSAWQHDGSCKVLLYASEEDLEQLGDAWPSERVHDAGLNHVAAGSFTVLALYPVERARVGDAFKRFKLV